MNWFPIMKKMQYGSFQPKEKNSGIDSEYHQGVSILKILGNPQPGIPHQFHLESPCAPPPASLSTHQQPFPLHSMFISFEFNPSCFVYS